jgi:HK97 family phage major capsid protein
MSTALVEKQQALDAARAEAREFYAANPTEKIAQDADLKERAQQHNRKMADLHSEVATLQEIEEGQKQAAAGRKSAGRTVTEDDGEIRQSGTKAFDAGEAWANSDGLARLKAVGMDRFTGTVELVEYPQEAFKTLLQLSTLTPRSDRRPGIVPMGLDETTVGDLVLPGTTDSNVVSYYEETTVTNAAATVAEGAAKPESTLAFTERTDTVRKIATWIPATSEFLEDNAGIRSYIEGRLRFMVEREEEDQLLNGDGTAPNISGILDRSGLQTVTSTNDMDAIYRAITEVRVDGFAEPTAVVIHPLSWQNLRLAKDSNGMYHGAGPFAGRDQGENIWGLPVRVTPLIAEGTALVGAFRPFAQVFRKGGIRVVASTEHSTYFTENKVAILAEERLTLAVYRPAAFCQVTGLASS